MEIVLIVVVCAFAAYGVYSITPKAKKEVLDLDAEAKIYLTAEAAKLKGADGHIQDFVKQLKTKL